MPGSSISPAGTGTGSTAAPPTTYGPLRYGPEATDEYRRDSQHEGFQPPVQRRYQNGQDTDHRNVHKNNDKMLPG